MKEMYYAGTPATLVENTTYALTFCKGFGQGELAFLFRDNNTEKHKHYLDVYYFEPDLSRLRFDPAHISLKLMTMVISDDRKEAFRGQVYCVEEKNTKGIVGVMDVDSCRFIECHVNNLYEIHEDYLLEPFNSFVCALDGLEFFNSSTVLGIAIKLNHELLIGKEIEGTCTGYWNSESSKESLPLFRICVGKLKTEFNTIMLDSVYELCAGRLPTGKGDKTKVPSFPIHVEESGALFLHLEPSFFSCMKTHLAKIKIDEFLSLGKKYKDKELSRDEVYLIPVDGVLQRAKFLEVVAVNGNDAQVRLICMDQGNIIITELGLIRSSSVISPHLQKIPALCHKVFLKWVKMFKNLDKVWEEIGGNMYYVNVSSKMVAGCPVVALQQKKSDGSYENLNKHLVSTGIATYDFERVKMRPTGRGSCMTSDCSESDFLC